MSQKLSFGLGLDLSGLDRDLARAEEMISGLGKNGTEIPTRVGGAGAGGDVAPDAGAIGERVAAGLARANAPLTAFAGHMHTMFDRVGGTIITALRRIDENMKFPQIDASLTKVKTGLFTFAKSWAPASARARQAGTEIVAAVAPVVPILKEIELGANQVVTAESKLYNPLAELGKAWDGLRERAAKAQAEMQLAADRGPKAGDRPGRGRAVNLPKEEVGALDKALIGVFNGVEKVQGAMAKIGPAAASAFQSASTGAGIFGQVLLKAGEGTWLGLSAPLRVLALFGAGAVAAGQGVWRLKSALDSIGDVAGKTFGKLFEQGGILRSTLGAATSAVLTLGSAMLRVGTLGVFGKAKNDAAGLGKQATAARGSFDGLRSSARSLGREILVAFGVFGLIYKAANAIKNFFVKGVEGAVHLNETISASDVTFGKFSGQVLAYADKMAKGYGLVKNQTLTAAVSFGDFASAAGLSGKAAADFSIKATQLAADLTSFKDISMEEAATKIRSALAGEAEPLRRFGVLITEDLVKAKALSMGIAGVTRTRKSATVTLTEQAKIMARSALISEGLRRATGDLERTQGGAANQFRKAGGGLENFATSIGQVLLPAINPAIVAFNDLLATAVGAFEKAKPYVETFAAGVAAAFDRVGAVFRNLDLVWQVTVLKFREGFMNFVAILAVLPENLAIVGEWIANNWVRLILDAFGAIKAAVVNLATNLAAIGAAFWEWIQNPSAGFNFNWTPVLDGFKATVDELPKLAQPAWVSMKEDIDKVWKTFDEREDKRKKALSGANVKVPDAKAATAKVTKPAETKLAEAAEINSKEAYSVISKNLAEGRRGKDPINDVAKNTRDANKLLGKIADGVTGNKTTPPPPTPAFSF